MTMITSVTTMLEPPSDGAAFDEAHLRRLVSRPTSRP